MPKVLICDDSATARNIFQRCLEVIGCRDWQFLHACDGEEALQILRKGPVDLVITDFNMPKMDGKRLLQCVKSSPKLTGIPVFVVTSLGTPHLEKELGDLGASVVLSKPLVPGKIRAAIQRSLGKDVMP